ncbi:hypothetical protein ABV409_11120 [Flagellimonas sp. DF-77]|uniref:hypothetical protein n=1 Tax=Flagellimonas algarum TaxID=3230298 RepID=UPI003390AEC8
MKPNKLITLFTITLSHLVYAQQVTPQHTGLEGTGSTSPFHMVAVDQHTVWASASNTRAMVKEHTPNVITHTNDGGISWKNEVLPADTPDTFYVSCLTAVSKDSAWISTVDRMDFYKPDAWKPKIYATFDGGAHWTVQEVPFSDGYGGQIHFFNHQEGIVFASNADGYFQVFKTYNAGKDWKRLPASNLPELQSTWEIESDDSYYAIEDTIWVGTMGRILKSTDRGTTWTAYSTPLTDRDMIFEVSFSDPLHGIARYHDRGDYFSKNMIVTSDGGKSWSKLSPQGLADKIFDLNSIPITPGGFLCSSYSDTATTSNKLYYSTDNGATWSVLEQLHVPGRISLSSATHGWVSEIDPNTPEIDVYRLHGPIPSAANTDGKN